MSPRGENLLFSVLVRVTCPPSRLPPLALVAGLAARDAIARAAPVRRLRIKWPNDVVVGPRGRRSPASSSRPSLQGRSVEALVVGIGVNVHTRSFPDDLAARATSVALETDRPPDRAEILADVLATLDRDLELVAARGLGLVHARLASADALRGERVECDSGEAGTAEGIDLEGRLLVRREDGVLARWGAGECGSEVVGRSPSDLLRDFVREGAGSQGDRNELGVWSRRDLTPSSARRAASGCSRRRASRRTRAGT